MQVKTNTQNIYSKMKPEELALISFKAIGREDANLMDTIEASIEHKTYVGRDINYSQNLNNRVHFCVWFGLQYHSLDSQLIKYYENVTVDEFNELHSTNEHPKQLLLNMACDLCDEYSIDKATFLVLAQINMTVDELEAVDRIEPDSKALISYKHKMATLFDAVLNQNYGN